MLNPQMIENEQYFYCSQGHNLPVVTISLDPKLSANQRFLCTQCLENTEINGKMIGLKKIQSQIEEGQIKRIQKAENIIIQDIKQIEFLFSIVDQMKSLAMSLLDETMAIMQKWIQNLQQQIQQQCFYSFQDELEKVILNKNYISENLQLLIHEIQKSNNSWISKLSNKLELFGKFQEYSKCIEILSNLELVSQNIIQREPQQELNSNSQLNIIYDYQEFLEEGQIKLKLINQSVKQRDTCRAIVFNSSESIMISTSDEEIKVWSLLNGAIKLITTLHRHTDWIQCLVYSKKQNSFISGALDETIVCWQQQDQSNWICSQPYQQHTQFIRCIILNSNEDFLFSGSQDQSIKVWKVDFNQNKLTYYYSLDKHINAVASLSLNQQENQLVSSADKGNQIIIWERRESNKFVFKYFVTQSIQYDGFKVKFINLNQFIWITGGEENDKLYIFELNEGVFKERNEKTLQLMKNNSIKDENRFPIFYNKEKNLIVIRHKTFIYIIREMKNGKFKVVNQLNCTTNDIYGYVTNSGKYLVFWDKLNEGYSTYELLYN